ncbi:MAG: radical SAM family heme chaperone HemW [Ferruginibacter sp.]
MAGIYIHIPFCKQACTYCNFHFSTSLKQKRNLIDALNKEILLSPLFTTNEQIDTIYIGGGTPSLLSATELETIFETIHKKFSVHTEAEITLEANPDDIDTSILDQWRQTGINRLSLGIQSFSDTELIWMNRAHNAVESLNSIDKIQEAGFTNFSVDLIYGSPLLSNDDLKKNLDIIFKKNIPHISCYALTVEPKTALDKMIGQKRSLPVDAEKQAAQFLLLMDLLKEQGYEHYEISNFAKPGLRSKHNSSYWNGKAYYGFGPSAHSFDGKKTRRWNIANNSLYIDSISKDIIPFEEEILTETQQLNEYIMTALRTMEGLDLGKIRSSFGNNSYEALIENSRKYTGSKKMILEAEKLILTREGKLFADGIAADLFF